MDFVDHLMLCLSSIDTHFIFKGESVSYSKRKKVEQTNVPLASHSDKMNVATCSSQILKETLICDVKEMSLRVRSDSDWIMDHAGDGCTFFAQTQII